MELKRKTILALASCVTGLFWLNASWGMGSNEAANTHQTNFLTTLRTNETILDFGGLQSEAQKLAQRVPKGRVFLMEPFVDSALEANNVLVGPFEQEHYVDRVIVHDSLTTHPKQHTLLKQLTGYLKAQGKLLLDLPDYRHGPVGKALSETWIELQELVFGSPYYLVYSPTYYQRLVEEMGLTVNSNFYTQKSQKFASVKELKLWLKTHWRYFQAISPQDKELFLNTFLEHYLDFSGQSKHGPVVWEQTHWNLEAVKAA